MSEAGQPLAEWIGKRETREGEILDLEVQGPDGKTAMTARAELPVEGRD